MAHKKDPVKLLKENHPVQLSPSGFSMYPFINPDKKDQVVIEPVNISMLKKGDVVLYRREKDPVTGGPDTRLILHRICKIKNNTFYMVGDNQTFIEGPISGDHIYGIMTSIIKKGKIVPASGLSYRIKASAWLFLRPFRTSISVTVASIKKIFR